MARVAAARPPSAHQDDAVLSCKQHHARDLTCLKKLVLHGTTWHVTSLQQTSASRSQLCVTNSSKAAVQPQCSAEVNPPDTKQDLLSEHRSTGEL